MPPSNKCRIAAEAEDEIVRQTTALTWDKVTVTLSLTLETDNSLRYVVVEEDRQTELHIFIIL